MDDSTTLNENRTEKIRKNCENKKFTLFSSVNSHSLKYYFLLRWSCLKKNFLRFQQFISRFPKSSWNPIFSHLLCTPLHETYIWFLFGLMKEKKLNVLKCLKSKNLHKYKCIPPPQAFAENHFETDAFYLKFTIGQCFNAFHIESLQPSRSTPGLPPPSLQIINI